MAKHIRRLGFDSKWLAARMIQRPNTPAHNNNDGIEIVINTVKAGEILCVISLRNAIFCGESPTNIVFDDDIEIRSLRYENGEWMTDTPQEVWQMRGILERLRAMDEPRLLVGGLGLGVLSHLATQYGHATVTTVERDQRIIEAVGPFTDTKIVRGDIYDYAEEIKAGDYHIACMDTWQSTGEHCWVTEVVPLRRKLAKVIPEIWCWQEAEMVGQIRNSGLLAMCYHTDQIPRASVHLRVLQRAAEKAGLLDTIIASDNDLVRAMGAVKQLDSRAIDLMERFLANPGSPSWEDEFGSIWDEFYNQYLERKV